MTPLAIGLIGMVVLIVLMLVRVPVAVAIGLTGYLGYAAIDGWDKASSLMGTVPLELSAAYSLSVFPLFVLMGALVTSAGLSKDLFQAANGLFRGTRGSLGMAALLASALFSAVCGSSLATAATMSRVSIPEMIHAGYSPRLAAGVVAAGGTLGILIPPSLILMIYAIIAQQSVAKLFAAALLPGVLLTVLYMAVVVVVVRLQPAPAAVSPPTPAAPRGTAGRLWPIGALFIVTLGGIYGGIFTPTEAAAVGAFGSLVIAAFTRRLSWRKIGPVFMETVRNVAGLLFIVMASMLFSYFVVQTGISQAVIEVVGRSSVSPVEVIVAVCAVYVLLGCILEGIGMILITVPIVLPLVTSFGWDPVWFGVLLVVLVEIGLIHPPLGMNIFIIRATVRDLDTKTISLGIIPFLAAPFILLCLMIAWPELALWLPGQMR
ncbi:TRAP transporter large permease [Chelatococcus sp. GCM10030263]|uniref:TRAP transporter large permease n=1 Tax=Chelatococcus sp. GCM10030263 TaxID=3273387 RepID=UPI003612910B